MTADARGSLAQQIRVGDNLELRLLAARGLVPVPLEELVTLQVYLAGLDEPEISPVAADSLRQLDPQAAVGVIAEVVIFLLMHHLLPMFGARKLLLFTFALTTLRWLLIGFYVDNLTILFAAQLIHAFSFGVFHAVGISLVHDYFTGSHQGRGQALYSSVSFGAGVAAGSLVSGLVWDGLGAAWLFSFVSLCTVIAFFIIWRYVHADPSH